MTRFTSVAAPHPTMPAMSLVGERRRAIAGEHLVGTFGEVAARVDESAVEIEYGESGLASTQSPTASPA